MPTFSQEEPCLHYKESCIHYRDIVLIMYRGFPYMPPVLPCTGLQCRFGLISALFSLDSSLLESVLLGAKLTSGLDYLELANANGVH